YISATIRTLHPDTQEDVRAELTASIADAVEARLEQGEQPGAAEREVLTDLGDPAVLAAGYADRPLHLLGPRYYLVWKRLLVLLLRIVPACALVGVGLAQALSGAESGTIIGEALGIALTTAAAPARLTDLAAPAWLAAGSADRPLLLLGPRYSLVWKRLLVLLLRIVPACALVGVGLAQALSGAEIGTIIGEALGIALTTAVH